MTDTARPADAVRELALEPGGLVELLLTANDVRIRAADGDRVVVRARSGRGLDDDITIETSPGHVRIRDGGTAEFRLGPIRVRSHGAVDLDVDIPRTARVGARTLSGDVDASGIGGESRWSTASGDLRIRVDAGPVSLDSMSGDLLLEASVPVAVTARSVSGEIRVRAPRLDAVSVETTSGDVLLDGALAAGAAHTVSSVSGDVQVATGSPVRLDAQTVTGDVRASVPHRAEGGRGHRTLVVGDGSVALSLRTMSGDVRLRGGTTEPVAAPAAPTPMPAPAPAAAPKPPAARAPAWPPVPAMTQPDAESARLEILRALERGELDVEAASKHLEALEGAAPKPAVGWG